MVKLTLTLTAAMAAAAVLADVGSSQPNSPLAPRQPFLRQKGSGGSDMGFGSAGSEVDMPPPHDFSSSMDADYAGRLGDAHRPPSPKAGSLEKHGRGQGRGSLDGRFPPPPDAGSHGVPPFPDRDQLGKTHRKALENDKPDDQTPPSPRARDAHVPHKHGSDMSGMGSGSLRRGSGSVDRHFPPPPEAGCDDKPPSPRRERDGVHRKALQNDGNGPPPSWQGGSNAKQETPYQDRQFPPPPNAGGNGGTSAVGSGDHGANDVKAPMKSGKAGGGNSSGSHHYNHDVGAGNNEGPRTGDKRQ
uniref:RxLR effector protein n=1 Tax=Phytophthora ramorum TaxID=164328 RepID=H3GU57_PHYRM